MRTAVVYADPADERHPAYRTINRKQPALSPLAACASFRPRFHLLDYRTNRLLSTNNYFFLTATFQFKSRSRQRLRIA